MISSLDAVSGQFLSDLQLIQDRVDRAERQISSGRLINSASDAPDQISEVLQLHADLGRNTQIRTNLSSVKAEVDTADAALQDVVKILERARVLAAQGASGTTTAESRQALATEAQGLFDSMVSISRMTVAGRFLFGGDQDQSPPYDAYGNRLIFTWATRRAEDPRGGSFAYTKTAQEIFDHRNPDDTSATDNAFAAMRDLLAGLKNNDQEALDQSISELQQSDDHINVELGFYGNIQNRVTQALDAGAKQEVQWKTRLSALEDADVTAAILELNQATLHQEAALQAHARLPTKTLFDYLA